MAMPPEFPRKVLIKRPVPELYWTTTFVIVTFWQLNTSSTASVKYLPGTSQLLSMLLQVHIPSSCSCLLWISFYKGQYYIGHGSNKHHCSHEPTSNTVLEIIQLIWIFHCNWLCQAHSQINVAFAAYGWLDLNVTMHMYIILIIYLKVQLLT